MGGSAIPLTDNASICAKRSSVPDTHDFTAGYLIIVEVQPQGMDGPVDVIILLRVAEDRRRWAAITEEASVGGYLNDAWASRVLSD